MAKGREAGMLVGYARVSSKEQNLDPQLAALKAAGCEKIFSEKVSGAKDDRVELGKCLKFLNRGDTLVVYKFDRLGRSLKHLVNTVMDLNERGVSLVVTTLAIDTRTPTGKLLFGIIAAVAEFERSMIRERQEAGIKAAKARGVRFGRQPIDTSGAEGLVAIGIPVTHAVAQTGISRAAFYARRKRSQRSVQ